MSQILQTTPKKEAPIEYTPFGAEHKITLSLAIIRNYIAEPAIRDGKYELPDDRQCMKFMMLCRARKLDPFEGDSFMIPFWDKRKNCNVWSLITAHNAFQKRAEVHPDYDGKCSGIIINPAMHCRPCSGSGAIKDTICPVCQGKGAIDELEGDFMPDAIDGEVIHLVGGWARVFFKKKLKPEYQRLKLSTYQKQFGVWMSDSAGMICKCAEAAALRAAFPNTLGGMYLREEMGMNSDLDLTGGFTRPQFGKESPVPQLPENSEPPAAPTATPAVTEAAKAEVVREAFNPVKALRNLCKSKKLAEAELIDYLGASGALSPEVNSLESMALNDPDALTMAIDQFSEIMGRIETMKKGIA
jgi:hypothetical protein